MVSSGWRGDKGVEGWCLLLAFGVRFGLAWDIIDGLRMGLDQGSQFCRESERVYFY